MEEDSLNTTAIATSADSNNNINFISADDTLHEDYFRLYDASIDGGRTDFAGAGGGGGVEGGGGGGGAEASQDYIQGFNTNFLLGIWNPFQNQSTSSATNTTTDTFTIADNDNDDGDDVDEQDFKLATTWTTLQEVEQQQQQQHALREALNAVTNTTALPLGKDLLKTTRAAGAKFIRSTTRSSTKLAGTTTTASAAPKLISSQESRQAKLPFTQHYSNNSDFMQPYDDNETLSLYQPYEMFSSINSTALSKNISKSSSSTISASTATHSTASIASSALPSSYADDIDIALIDSSENQLLNADSDDYTLFAGKSFSQGFADNDDAADANFLQQYSTTPASDSNSSQELNDTLPHHLSAFANGLITRNGDDDATNGGSSFMLLLENFGEYFYNFNDTASADDSSSISSSINPAGSLYTSAGSYNGIDGSGGSSSSLGSDMVLGTITRTISSSSAANSTGNSTNFDYRMNCTNYYYTNLTTNLTTSSVLCYEAPQLHPEVIARNYWALILIAFPIFTLFGNILVILSVFRERSLQTVTNYFIVSLAIADLLVAVVVMPFGVYALVNNTWGLPYFACDFYIAMDVICSTSSIFNLVAISVDRYIAVTQPIKYAKHRNSRRVCLTIVMVWAISAAIGSPIVLGLNNTPDRDPSLCMFYNTDFILYSSLSSFYIPCIIMVFLYWNIFKALRIRARKQRAARKPHLSELTGGSVIENIAQTRRLAETALDSTRQGSGANSGSGSGGGVRIMPDEPATNTGSGSNEEEDENAISPDIDDCHVIVNDKSTEFMLATVVEETGNVVAQITSQPQLMVADSNGNHDSGYAPSNVDDVLAGIAEDSTPPESPVASGTMGQRSAISSRRNTTGADSPRREQALSSTVKPLSFMRYGVQEAMTLARHDSTLSTTSKTSARKDKKNTQASRFTIYKVHKASKKKREKTSAKKERKATKTLAIVLGVFLFCWLPFFSCNILDAMCTKFNEDCSPGVTAFIFTTWLGYINSFVNPVIYTIFNPEFRKAFKKIMHMG